MEKYLDIDDFLCGFLCYYYKLVINMVNIFIVLLIIVKVKLILKYVYKKMF